MAVCLLSGGLDSTTCLALARRDGYECYALSFDYGQRHRIELDAAARVAASFGAREHRTAQIDLRAFGASALTADIDVPKHLSAADLDQGIPVTYVPARNTIFLSYALAWAEVLEASDAVRLRILEGRRSRLEERVDTLRQSLTRGRERVDAYTLELQKHGLESVEREVRWLNELISTERQGVQPGADQDKE